MKFLEKDLETIIYETDNVLLQDRGLDVFGKKLRQLRIGNYGIADLVTYYRENDGPFINPELVVAIYELKQNNVGIETLIQSIGYYKGIRSYLKRKYPNLNYTINIVLVGKTFSDGNFIYLPDIFDKIRVYTYDYEIDGLRFTERGGYKLVEEGF